MWLKLLIAWQLFSKPDLIPSKVGKSYKDSYNLDLEAYSLYVILFWERHKDNQNQGTDNTSS